MTIITELPLSPSYLAFLANVSDGKDAKSYVSSTEDEVTLNDGLRRASYLRIAQTYFTTSELLY